MRCLLSLSIFSVGDDIVTAAEQSKIASQESTSELNNVLRKFIV